MGRRAEDGGRSECPPVAGGIGVESSGEITPRESGPTSLGSFVTREPGKPLQGASRTVAFALLVRPPTRRRVGIPSTGSQPTASCVGSRPVS